MLAELGRLQLVDVVLADDVLQDRVEFIEDLDPCIQVRPRPLPRVDGGQKAREILRRRRYNARDELRDFGMLACDAYLVATSHR